MAKGVKKDRYCTVCTQIDQFLTSPSSSYDPNFDEFVLALGTETSLLEQCCSRCKSLVLPRKGEYNTPCRWIEIEIFDTTHEVALFQRPHSRKWLAQVVDDSTRALPTMHTGKILDTCWVDVQALRTKMQDCFSRHDEKCSWPTHLQNVLGARPCWLIDVNDYRITRASPDMPYVTLSYVWGGIDSLNLLTSNVSVLQEKGALKREWSPPVPKTIRDSIELVRLLGLRYLWVDCLCIEQDNAANKNAEIDGMGSLYANALLAIVAAQGDDGDFGLRGISQTSGPRALDERKVHNVGKLRLLEVSKGLYRDSKWRTRGWTFQESIFSTRKIIFDADMVHWQCSHTWLEDHIEPADDYIKMRHIFNPRRFRQWLQEDFWPDIAIYTSFLHAYNKRELSFGEDAFRAFAGIANMAANKYEYGMVCAVPELYFDDCLLWRQVCKADRRMPSKSSNKHLLPSWSWMSWKVSDVEVLFPNDASAEDSEYGVRLIPRVDWYCGATRTGSRRRVEGSKVLYQHILDAHDISKPLPAGWNRIRTRRDTLSSLDTQLSHLRNEKLSPWWFLDATLDPDEITYYVYEGHEDFAFLFPLPIRDPKRPVHVRPPEPFLFCGTELGSLYINPDDDSLNNSRGAAAQRPLRSTQGLFTGVIYPDYDEAVKPTSATEHTIKGIQHRRCDVILVSEGYAIDTLDTLSATLPECDHPEFPKNGQLYRFINVLWVEWKDGVAYRRGVGRVLKSVWENELDLTEMDIVLN